MRIVSIVSVTGNAVARRGVPIKRGIMVIRASIYFISFSIFLYFHIYAETGQVILWYSAVTNSFDYNPKFMNNSSRLINVKYSIGQKAIAS